MNFWPTSCTHGIVTAYWQIGNISAGCSCYIGFAWCTWSSMEQHGQMLFEQPEGGAWISSLAAHNRFITTLSSALSVTNLTLKSKHSTCNTNPALQQAAAGLTTPCNTDSHQQQAAVLSSTIVSLCNSKQQTYLPVVAAGSLGSCWKALPCAQVVVQTNTL